MTDVSVLIPARQERFLARTIQSVLDNARADTEIIAVLDGAWADPPVPDDPRVTLLYYPEAIGQRAATNAAARVAQGRYVMKLDAHCAVAEGFDVTLMQDCPPDWTVIPRMYNLHAFDWVCRECGTHTYQGPVPTLCQGCGATNGFDEVVIWQPRWNRRADFARFDRELHFQYWREYEKRPEAQGEIADTLCFVGACFFMERARYWQLGGLDEAHGSWGQMGVEIACKTWLSGGRLVVNKRTWFAHLFRTQPGFGFPYPLTNADQERARAYSRDLWLNDKWPGAVKPFAWLLEKFNPPDWTEDRRPETDAAPVSRPPSPVAKGIVYYTDNRLDKGIQQAVWGQLGRVGVGGVAVSLAPLAVPAGWENLVWLGERGILTMFEQILAGLEASTAEVIYFCEHDVLYHPSHFDFIPPRPDVFYYNENCWKVDATMGHALFYYARQTSGLVAHRALLLEHYRKRVEIVRAHGYSRKTGFEPGTHRRAERVDDYTAESFFSACPNVDLRHANNLTPSRWQKAQFRDQRYTRGWTEAEEVPGWGRTAGRMGEFLEALWPGR